MARLSMLRHYIKKNKVNRKTVSQKIKISEKLIGFSVAALICIIGLLYIFQTNSVATKGYDLEKYEKKLADLQKENQKMIIELADLESMNNLENKTNEFCAINYKDINYVASTSGIVAME